MQNQLCRVCDEPAAGFHFGAFTCEGCKSFFGRTCNNQSTIQECKNNYGCVINKKNRTACKACRLRKCLMVGMSKAGSRYGRRSNWFKIHCLMQQVSGARGAGSGGSGGGGAPVSPPSVPASPSSEPILSTTPSAKTSVASRNGSLVSPPLWRPLDTPSPKPRSASPAPKVPPHPPPANHASQQAAAAASLNFLASLKSQREAEAASKPAISPPIVPATGTPSVTSSLGFPPSLYSHNLFNSPLPFLPPTFNLPGLSALPLHKQALLSPLLASSHILAAAAARKAAYSPFNGTPVTSSSADAQPPVSTASESPVAASADILAEHKALLERFRASAAAAAAMAAAAGQHAAAEQLNGLAASNNNEVIEKAKKEDEDVGKPLKEGKRKENGSAMDLTKRPSSSAEDSISSVGSEEIIPNLSDTDEEDQPIPSKRRKPDEMPLDLTCV